MDFCDEKGYNVQTHRWHLKNKVTKIVVQLEGSYFTYVSLQIPRDDRSALYLDRDTREYRHRIARLFLNRCLIPAAIAETRPEREQKKTYGNFNAAWGCFESRNSPPCYSREHPRRRFEILNIICIRRTKRQLIFLFRLCHEYLCLRISPFNFRTNMVAFVIISTNMNET